MVLAVKRSVLDLGLAVRTGLAVGVCIPSFGPEIAYGQNNGQTREPLSEALRGKLALVRPSCRCASKLRRRRRSSCAPRGQVQRREQRRQEQVPGGRLPGEAGKYLVPHRRGCERVGVHESRRRERRGGEAPKRGPS